jgi:hypothetical protein
MLFEARDNVPLAQYDDSIIQGNLQSKSTRTHSIGSHLYVVNGTITSYWVLLSREETKMSLQYR